MKLDFFAAELFGYYRSGDANSPALTPSQLTATTLVKEDFWPVFGKVTHAFRFCCPGGPLAAHFRPLPMKMSRQKRTKRRKDPSSYSGLGSDVFWTKEKMELTQAGATILQKVEKQLHLGSIRQKFALFLMIHNVGELPPSISPTKVQSQFAKKIARFIELSLKKETDTLLLLLLLLRTPRGACGALTSRSRCPCRSRRDSSAATATACTRCPRRAPTQRRFCSSAAARTAAPASTTSTGRH